MNTLSHRLSGALRIRHGVCVAAAATVLALCMAPAAIAQPVSNSTLYYRLGGGSPSAGANNRGQNAMRLGFSTRLNYSCGKFDIGLSWSNVMDGFKNLGTTVSNAVKAGISSLPLYVLQRAQPGLYQLFQNFSQKADILVAASLKSCEDMEAMIKSGQDPYEDWVKVAKGEAWKAEASASGDVVDAKKKINRDEKAQNEGVAWVFGQKAGGVSGRPIQPIRDLSVAGYNATLNRPTSSSSSANFSGSSEKSTRLVRAFASPDELATWATEVLGDRSIFLCSQSTCPQPTTTSTATGLGPKYERELDRVTPALREMADAPGGDYRRLSDVSAPGMSVSPQLVDALRKLPADSRSIAVNRLSQELSMQRVIDKALIARNVLITGLSLPEVTKAGEQTKEVQVQIDRLTQYINDMMFEFRIRKEMTADTALAIMGNSFANDSRATRVPDGAQGETAPLVDGRVKTQ
ncbi:integrating conjugative element protein [Variovorax sp. ZS18.2.2]|uniref:integrating conjugative element protein n=1 Tax=Variovorax sp. ZS18.2.2 TaxID=2971255 RepID=UPI00215099F2|nr:integrating conjugative element protein [Variovorax sp. ZS18.2.2]MCR6480996.1 integrating conjugative element protein [Variovorax sp. ZS18.2.2]